MPRAGTGRSMVQGVRKGAVARTTRITIATAVIALTLGVGPGAHAAFVTCAGLQAALDAVPQSNPIFLSEMCVGMSFDLAPDDEIQIIGEGANAGFDGTGAPRRALTGIGVSHVFLLNLTFRNYMEPEGAGGAVRLEMIPGTALTLAQTTFEFNESVSPDPCECSVARRSCRRR